MTTSKSECSSPRTIAALYSSLRRKRPFIRLAVLLVAIPHSGTLSANAGQAIRDHASQLRYERTSLAFEPSTDGPGKQVTYSARGRGFDLVLSRQSAALSLSSPANSEYSGPSHLAPKIHVVFPNSRQKPGLVAENRMPGNDSYYVSRKSQNWQVGLPLFGQVRYPELYRGIDLVFHGNPDQLEYDFLVRAGINPAAIRLRMKGAERMEVDPLGNLILQTAGREIRFRKPIAYQVEGATRKLVDVSYALMDREDPARAGVAFTVGNYDHAKPLVIDPVLEYAGYVGTDSERVAGVAADSSGAAYVVLGTGVGSFTIRKFGLDGNLERSATIALQDLEGKAQATAIAVSSMGAVYVAGYAGPGLPTGDNAAQGLNEGGTKAFLAVLEPKSGSLVLKYLTYLGGSSTTLASGLAVDSTGAAYIVGDVSAGEFPTTANALQPGFGIRQGSIDFLCKVAPGIPGASAIVYATLLGAGGRIHGVATDSFGNAYVVRDSDGGIAGTQGAFNFNGPREGANSIEVTKINAAGSEVVYSANLGPGFGAGIAVDGSGAAYLTGISLQDGLPASPGAYQSQAHGGFVAKLNAAGSEFSFVTYLGGTGSVEPRSIAIEPGCPENCSPEVTGLTSATDFPLIHPFQAQVWALPTVFAVKLASDGSSAEYSTFMGGATSKAVASSSEDRTDYIAGPTVAVDGIGFSHITGNLVADSAAGATDFPVTVLGPQSGAFLARVGNSDRSHLVVVPAKVSFNPAIVGGTPATTTILLRNMGSAEVSLQPIDVSPSNEFQETDKCGERLPGGASCAISIRFTPVDVGDRAGSISIQSNGGQPYLTVPLAGLGVDSVASPYPVHGNQSPQASVTPALSGSSQATLNPTTLAFGNRLVGSPAISLSATLTNNGTAPLALSTAVLGGTNASQFAFVTPAPSGFCATNSTLAVNASCTINVKYTATVLGTVSGTVTITDNAASSPQTLSLSGTGTAYPVPFTQEVSPLAVAPGSSALTLNLQGVQLASGAVAKWNGTSLTTSVISATKATATVPASLLATAGNGTVTLVNPKPTAVISNPVYIPVTTPINTLGFSANLFAPLAVNQATAPLAIDINGDSKSDLVVLDALDGNVQAFTNAGSGRLSLKSTTTVGASPIAVAAGDFNDDGKLDLAVLNTSGTVSILTGDGTGNYTVANTFSSGTQGQTIVAGDFNGDGYLDLAVLNSSLTSVSLLLGSGTGTFTLASTISVGVSPYGMVVADFNRDGFLDLAVGNGDGTVSVLLGNGAGGFSPVSPAATGSSAAAIATADFNGDGFADLAIGGTNGAVTILTGTGGGNFAIGSTVATNSPVSSIAIGDFNGNGNLGFAVAGPGANQAAIFFGTGQATFTAGPILTTVAGPTVLAAADFSNAGYPSLAIASSSANSVQVQFQEPIAAASPTSIAFPPQIPTTHSQPYSVTILNNGSLGLTISAISINPGSNTGANDFAQTNNCGTLPVTLASGASCTLAVTFTPSKIAGENATLSLTDNSAGANSTQKVMLSGTGVSVYTTQASISAPAISYGANAQVVATVTGSDGTPTGNVTLTVTGNAPITQALSGGSATFTIPGLAPSTYNLSLTYAAQGSYGASSATGTLVVNAAAPTTASITAPPISYGQNAQITATISSAAGQPGGTVSLTLGSNAPLTQTLSGGSATFSIPGLTPSTYNLSLTYAAQGNYAASSATGTLVVNPASTTASIVAAPISYGQSAQIAVTVSSTPGQPSGAVSLTVGSSAPFSQPLVSGVATFSVPNLTAGQYALNATFATQGNFAAASATGSQSVTQATPTATWSAPAPISVGTPLSSVQLNATASVVGTFAYSPPAGAVLGVGANQPLLATFTPQDTVDYTTTTATTSITVNAAATSIGLNAPAITYGATAMVAVSVNSQFGVPGGVVSLSIGANSPISSPLNNGIAVFSVPGLTVANYALTANYSQQGNYAASGASGTLVVTPAVPVLQWNTPLPIPTADPLSSTQLDATAAVPGSFAYTPAAGTILGPGLNQNLSAVFTPTDTLDYTTASISTTITVTANPVPLLNPIVPSAVSPSTALAGFTFNVTGTGFVPTSTVKLNGTPLVSAYNSSSSLTAAVPPGLISNAGLSLVKVLNPEVGHGGLSNTIQLPITGPFSNLLFGPIASSPTAVNQPVAMAAGQFDSTGNEDLAVVDALDGNVQIYLGNGAGAFTLYTTVGVGSNPVSIISGDFNEDGFIDLAVVNANGTVLILKGNGKGYFSVSNSFSAGQSAQFFATADLNLDGHLDLVVLNSASQTATVFLGSGTGTFTQSAQLATGVTPYGLSITDFNADGFPDLAIGNGDGTVSVYLGSSSGTFTPASSPATGSPASAIATGDFNEDGISDLAVAGTTGSVTVLTGAGNGTFSVASTTATATGTQALVVGDLDGDGHLDLAVSNQSAGGVITLLGNGNATFAAQPAVAAGTSPAAVAIADFNADGREDLAMANTSANGVSVLFQIPSIVFSATSLNFGTPVAGSATPPQSVTVSNAGSGPLTVSAISIAPGANAGPNDFTQTNNCGTLPAVIAPGAICTITVSLTASSASAEVATLTITSNTGFQAGATQNIPMFDSSPVFYTTQTTVTPGSSVVFGGLATASVNVTSPNGTPAGSVTLAVDSFPAITRPLSNGTAAFQLTGLTAGVHQFTASYAIQGNFGNSTSSASFTVTKATPTLTWPAPAAITFGTPLSSTQLNAASTVAGSFAYSPAAGTVLAGGSNQSLAVFFTPVDTSDYASVSGAASINVVASGSAVYFAPASLTFGNGTDGQIAPIQAATLFNPGTSSITLKGISIGGTSYALYSAFSVSTQSNSCSSTGTLAAGASCAVNIAFKPTSAAGYAGVVTVSYTIGTAKAVYSVTVSLTGNGLANPVPMLQPLIPSAILPGTVSSGTTLLLNGTGFNSGSVVTMSGQALATQLIKKNGAQLLSATVPAGLVTAQSTGIISVTNSKPTALISNPQYVEFTNPLAAPHFSLGPFSAETANQPIAILTVDVNHDGIPDLVVLDALDGAVLTYVGAGSGRATLSSTIKVGVNSVAIAAGDFNEDGKLDLVVASANGNLTMLLGNGAGSFTAQTPFSAASSALSIAAADLNGDGHWDLVVASPASGTATVLLGAGNGTFTAVTPVQAGVSPYGVAIADFNLDGIPDLAVGNADGSVSVFVGSGNGTFLSASSPVTGSPANALVIGDFNEDGIPDLAVLNTNNTVTVLTGSGTGLFTMASQSAVGNGPIGLITADLNGDGHLDLAVSNATDSTVSLLYGAGNATFALQSVTPVAATPQALAAVDMNNDGRVDLTVSSLGTNSVSILMQNPYTVTSATNLAFGSEIYGETTGSQTLTISNSGSAPLQVATLGIHPGYDSADFNMTTTCGNAPLVLNPLATCTATFTYTPSKVAVESAVFQITDNSDNTGGSEHYINLTGTGLAVPTSMAVTSPGTLVYGSPGVVTVTITSPTTVPTGSITLTIGNNAPLTQPVSSSGTATFQVSGLPVGTYPLIANYAAQYWYGQTQAFGTLTVQQATPAITWPAPVAINQGAPLTSAQLNATSPVAGSFVYTPPGGTVLGAGNSQRLSVAFTPTDTVNFAGASGSTTINVNSPSSATTFTLPFLTFGNQVVGTTSATQSTTLVNSGPLPVFLTGISVNGPSPSPFQFVVPTPTTSCLSLNGGFLPGGSSCTFDVAFIPSSTGSAVAAIQVSIDGGLITQSANLSGYGIYSASPFIEKVSPSAISPAVAAAGFTLNVLGTGFVPGALISINGQAVPTTVAGVTTLQAQVPAGLITLSETVVVSALNPGTGGAKLSNPYLLPITSPTIGVALGIGPFTSIPVTTPQGIVVADINGDGIPDFAIADSRDGEVLIYLGSASGAMTPKSTLFMAPGPVALTIGDFNEDGKLDLAVLSNTGNVTPWFGDGSGNFSSGTPMNFGSGGNFVVAADMNGDGHLDLAALNSASQTVSILLGSGTGSFTPASTLNTGVSPYGIAVADFNQDGFLDLAVGNADGSVSIFLGNGSGNFSLATSFETGAPGTALATGDFNEDGIPDLAIVNTGLAGVGTNGAVSVWTGSGNGLFVQGAQIPVGTNPDALVVADFNGDGHLDIVVANQAANSVQVLIGAGTGAFAAKSPQSAGSLPLFLGVGDFNNDGRLDIVAVDGGSNSVEVLMQIPQAQLSQSGMVFPAQAINVPSTPQSFTITNNGSATAPLIISGISITPAFNTGANDFTQANFCGTLPAALAPGTSCTISVTFSPSNVALENAVLTITDNTGNVAGSTQTVALNGPAVLPSNLLAASQVNLAPKLTIPSNFLGLSFDWNTAESWFGSSTTGTDPIFQQLLGNLMAYNSGPFVVRIAGDSIDTGTINSSTVVPFAQLAQNMNVHYILGVDLGLDTIGLAESQAAAYAASVPNNSIDAFEIGNEPDNYVNNGARGDLYSAQANLSEINTWIQGISADVPNVQRFAGPALAASQWMTSVEAAISSGNFPVNIVTQHSYVAGLNTANPWPQNYLLQPITATAAPNLYGPYAAIAHQAGQKFRMGEMNSIANGGQAGLSNNFTSALWGIDTMFAFANAGVDGVNFHTSGNANYNAFSITATTAKTGLNTFSLTKVNPLYYGMLMFAQAAGNGAQLLPVTTLTNANLDVWATLDNSGVVHLVIVNKDQVANGNLQFTVPGYNSGTAIPLTAPSYSSTNGVKIGGQTFDGSTNGTIQGTQSTQTVTSVNGVFSISVSPTSAVLINLSH